MNTYSATFTGRLNGSIGLTYRIDTYCKGVDEEAARIDLYRTYEHIRGLKLRECLNMDRINKLAKEVIEVRAYIAKCVKERELYEADKEAYKATYYDRLANDPEWRDRVALALQVVDQGIKATLFDYVENTSIDPECKLASELGLADDQPFRPFVDNYLRGIS